MSKYFQNDRFNLILLTIFNLCLRLFRLDSPPKPFFDEAVFYLEAARSYFTGFTDPNFEHPPLGKLIIALGIGLFGDNPWGWRLMSVVFGTLGVIIVYLLAKKIFLKTEIAVLAGFFLTFDFMWFVFSRVAMLDIFLATLSLGTVYFLWKYYQSEKRSDLYLFAIGLGLAEAVKWSAVFVLLGAVICLGIKYQKKWVKVIFDVVLVSLISVFVYSLSYVPYIFQNHTLSQVWDRQELIWQFHTNEVKTETAGAVRPYLWPLNPRQVFYHPQTNINSYIIVLANPFFFWGGLFTAGIYLKKLFAHWDPASGFLLIMLLSLFLPWFLVGRYLYFYYFLTALPLLAILLAKGVIDWEKEKNQGGEILRKLRGGFLTGNALGFLVFYPLLTALPVMSWYLHMLNVGL